jgi:hypothetical protein
MTGQRLTAWLICDRPLEDTGIRPFAIASYGHNGWFYLLEVESSAACGAYRKTKVDERYISLGGKGNRGARAKSSGLHESSPSSGAKEKAPI